MKTAIFITLFNLHSGTKIKQISSKDGFYKVVFTDKTVLTDKLSIKLKKI